MAIAGNANGKLMLIDPPISKQMMPNMRKSSGKFKVASNNGEESESAADALAEA